METPLTPLEFLRRARRLHGGREAVVDGAERWTYDAFGDRCDRWSSVLQEMGVGQGDRVAYIAPNSHAQLESFYAVPQLGAVLVPLNFRLIADDFKYLIQHSGAKVVCASGEYLDAVDSIRARPSRRHALRGPRHEVATNLVDGLSGDWLDYEKLVAAVDGTVHAARDRRARSADHQLHQRHDVAAQGRDDHAPQRVDELRRHADPHADDAARSLPVDAADVPRQRLDVHVDGDRRRRDARLPAEARSRQRVPAGAKTNASRGCAPRPRC